MIESIHDIGIITSTVKWGECCRFFRSKFKRIPPNKRTDFNIMMENINRMISNYENEKIKLKTCVNKKIQQSKLSSVEEILSDAIETLKDEMIMVILES